MTDIRFILGFVAGWIATTDEGKAAANKIAEKAVELIKSTANKSANQVEASSDK